MIVVPFAGLSKRFTDAGYTRPKYMLDLNGKTVFEHSLLSFKKYFRSEEFVFIGLDFENNRSFIEKIVAKLGIKKYHIILLNRETRGQAETVYLGLKSLNLLNPSRIIIFNIDTFRHNFNILDQAQILDGYLEVFKGSGLNWSYILPDSKNNGLVKSTAEKQEISNLCCSGIYVFANHLDFFEAFEYFLENELFVNNELYVAPLYNYLISNLKRSITYYLIPKDDVIDIWCEETSSPKMIKKY